MFFPILLIILTQFDPFPHPPTVYTGVASQYAPGKMQQVIAYRQRHSQTPLDLSPYDGFIAVLEADDIGRSYLMRPVTSPHWEVFLAVDCAGVADGGYAWMVNGGIIAEIDFASAKRWHSIGRGIEVEMMPMR